MTNPPTALPVIIRNATAPVFELPGVRFTGLAAPSKGSGQLCAWMITVDAGLASPTHHTLDRDEVFLVTSGTLRLHPGSEVLSAGDAGIVPAGSPIQLSNPGGTAATAYVALVAGFSARGHDGTVIGTPPWAQ